VCELETAAVNRGQARSAAATRKSSGHFSGGTVTFNAGEHCTIPGTIIFDGHQAMKGYALNKMFFSFNSAENREAYRSNEDAYCARFDIPENQRHALKQRDVLELLEEGGNIYYLAKWAGIFGLNVQQIGAQQRGMTEEEFKAMLVRAGGE
jgi:protocatechuate 4,5-dioxygenase alpha chain